MSENVTSQGPGGQALESSPTRPEKSRQNTFQTGSAKVKEKLEAKIGAVGRSLARRGARLVEPVVDSPFGSLSRKQLGWGIAVVAALVWLMRSRD